MVWAMECKSTSEQWKNHAPVHQGRHCRLPNEDALAVSSGAGLKLLLADASVRNRPATPYRIAVVDDHAAIRIALGRLLSAHGHRVEPFSTAEEFLPVALSTEVHCLLLDFHLPNMSGLDLAHQLAVIGYRRPIIFMTGSDDEDVRRQCLDFGCVAFLKKPIFESELTTALAAASVQLIH